MTEPQQPVDTQQPPTEESAAEESAAAKAKEVGDLYEPGARPTVTLPGTGGTVAGTAFADYVDADGNLKENGSDG